MVSRLDGFDLYARGKPAAIGRILSSPLLRSIKFQLIWRGFLDGLPGFVYTVIGCFNSCFKYSKLKGLNAIVSSDWLCGDDRE